MTCTENDGIGEDKMNSVKFNMGLMKSVERNHTLTYKMYQICCRPNFLYVFVDFIAGHSTR